MDTTIPKNPYVGPQSIKAGQAFFGRDREIRSLSSLLIAERIVMLHSPSGAGKTSLIQAGLIPRLSDSFSIYPMVRVNQELPQELQAVEGLNRYVYSTLLSFEEGLPPEKRMGHDQLASLTMDDYLNQRPLPDETLENCLLVFDQFEETITLSTTDIPQKREFFEQLGKTLQNRQRWVIFSIREDYMGGLAPYVRTIPNRLTITYRLGLLGSDAARQAIQLPAKNAGVDFTFDAAQKLVDDLRRIKVQQTDGSFTTELGPDVEPVQLQVVCSNLWRSDAISDGTFDVDDVDKYGKVDDALSNFYKNIIESVTSKTSLEERVLRRWFDNKLITKEGIRNQVLKGTETTEGLPNPAVALLEDAHLVRGETRGGKAWFELSHDRLVNPVRTNNAAWFTDNLSVVQRQSEVWDAQGRGEGLLLRGADLLKAEKETQIASLTSEEQAFMEASRKLYKREQNEKRLNFLTRIFLVVALVAGVVALIFFFQASKQKEIAQTAASTAEAASTLAINNYNLAATAQVNAENEKQNALTQATIARAGELAAQSQNDSDSFPVRGLLLALESMNTSTGESTQQEQALRSALQNVGGTPLNPDLEIIYDVVYDPGGKWLAASGWTGSYLWKVDPATSKITPVGALPGASDQAIRTMVTSHDGGWLALSSDDGKIQLWSMKNGQPSQVNLEKADVKADSMAFSPDNNWLAAATETKVLLWNLGSGTPAFTELPDKIEAANIVFGPRSDKFLSYGDKGFIVWNLNSDGAQLFYSGSPDQSIWSAVFSSAEDYLITRSGNGLEIYYIRPVNPYKITLPELPTSPTWYSVSINPAGQQLLATTNTNGTKLWDLASGASMTLKLPEGYDQPDEIYFSPDGYWLLASKDGAIWLWNLSNFEATVLGKEAYNLDFEASGEYLFTTNKSGDTINLWRLSELNAEPFSLFGHENSITTHQFSPDAKTLVTGANDGIIRVWNLAAPMDEPLVRRAYGKEIKSIQISQDGKWIATAEKGGSVSLRSAQDPSLSPVNLANFKWDDINNVNFSQDSHWLSSGTWNGQTLLWDMSTAGIENGAIKAPAEVYLDDIKDNYSVWLMPDPQGNYLAGVGEDNGAILWKFDSLTGQPTTLNGGEYRKTHLVISPDGRWMAAEEINGGKISVWDLNTTSSPPAELDRGPSSVNALDFSKDGAWLASGSQDNTLVLYHLSDKKDTSLDSIGTVNSLKFSPAGNWLAVGFYSGSISLWDTTKSDFPSPAPIKILTANPTGIARIEFSPDDHWMASLGYEGNLLLWDMTKPEVGAIAIKNKKIVTMSFSEDNQSLVTASEDGAIRTWTLGFDNLIPMACKMAGRNLTQYEWTQYFSDVPYHQTCPEWPVGK